MKIEKYRFDDAYQKVYKYDARQKAYIFLCTYWAAGINTKMNNSLKLRSIDTYENDTYENENF